MITLSTIEFILVSLLLYIGLDLAACGTLFSTRKMKTGGAVAILAGLSIVLATCAFLTKITEHHQAYSILLFLGILSLFASFIKYVSMIRNRIRYILKVKDSRYPEKIGQMGFSDLKTAVLTMNHQYQQVWNLNPNAIEKRKLQELSAVVHLKDTTQIKWNIEKI